MDVGDGEGDVVDEVGEVVGVGLGVGFDTTRILTDVFASR